MLFVSQSFCLTDVIERLVTGDSVGTRDRLLSRNALD